ncbi:MAG: transketolase [SAR202 cluster bacterium]|nr:transketolase [SAR202 cluster bacterium]|tara:strand:- start:4315 stop:6636 length:2322 start_codon:yes stop_codon:yes gene_type:complete
MKSLTQLNSEYQYWEIIKDLVDQCIDFMLNFSQSGHPGGSRSKVHAIISTLLSGVMRWDIRDPGKRFGDRFILVAGHTNPVVYATLAVFNEAMRIKYDQTGDDCYLGSLAEEDTLVWEDLLTLRRHGGLPGHAEMAGKTLFLKFNTGPSGHGSPAAVGEALAHKLAGSEEVKVFAFEGEGGLTTGASHEARQSAYGLGLGNLIYFVDWNDHGIDSRPYSDVVYGSPSDWFLSYGWKVEGTDQGEDWESIMQAYNALFSSDDPNTPKIIWTKNRKGRGYGVFDAESHGLPHKSNSKLFWKTKTKFAEKYNVDFQGFGEPVPVSELDFKEQSEINLKTVMSVLENNQPLIDYIATRLVELGDSVPKDIKSSRFNGANPMCDKTITNYLSYPAELFLPPGERAPNRLALGKFGSWLNSYVNEKYGRPLVIAASADLAGSTNISGFGKGWKNHPDFGFYDRKQNLNGTILPQAITEFANAGLLAGLATVNFHNNSYNEFDGFIGACSTYGSFSYLKYGPMRLFSQIAQDSDLKVGKLLWIAGHTGPETAEDARTHFGIFSPGVTQLFPDGHILNLHPWEYNEVAPAIGAALGTNIPIIALHLTRPSIEIPDREAFGIASHFDAGKGAYLIRDFDKTADRQGTVIIRGTSCTANLMQLLNHINDKGPNVKIVAAISWGLFQLQARKYRQSILSDRDMHDAMVITNSGLKLMHNWIANSVVKEYSLSSDWDNRWRTGGRLDEIVEEAHLSCSWLKHGIERFASERKNRLDCLRNILPKE